MSPDLVQQLKDRIEQLEEVLGTDRSLTDRLRQIFGLEPDEAHICGMLYRRERVTRTGLYDVLYGARPESEWPDDKGMDVKITRLRKKLASHGIAFDTHWGAGWSMARQDKIKIGDKLKKNMHAQASDLAKLRWKGLTAEQRSDFARRIAQARWEKRPA